MRLRDWSFTATAYAPPNKFITFTDAHYLFDTSAILHVFTLETANVQLKMAVMGEDIGDTSAPSWHTQKGYTETLTARLR